MFANFEIYRIDESGQPVWQDAAPYLQDAIAHVQRLSTTHPSEYLIRSLKTGVEVVMKLTPSAPWGLQYRSHSEPLTLRRHSEKRSSSARLRP